MFLEFAAAIVQSLQTEHTNMVTNYNIPKGIYLYSYATTEAQAKSEFAHILRLINGHKFELPIFIEM